jgi:hypothetical protein
MINKALGIIFVSFIAIIGVIFIGIGIKTYMADASFKESASVTTGMISKIHKYSSTDSDGSNSTEYDVYVEFYVDDELYEGQLNYHNWWMRKGQKIRIYYDPDKPGDFRGASNMLSLIQPILIGVIFILFSGGLLFLTQRYKKMNEQLKQKGKRVLADITDVVSDAPNSSHYRINCVWIDISTNTVNVFKSEYLVKDPRETLAQKNIMQLPVYIDGQDNKKYYVDTDALFQ